MTAVKGLDPYGTFKHLAVTSEGRLMVDAIGSGSGGGGGASTPVASFDFYRHLGVDGLVYEIPAGALAIDVMNIGATDLIIKSDSMVTGNKLTPIDQPGATVLQLRAPTGYVLEAATITFSDAAAGAEILTVRGAP